MMDTASENWSDLWEDYAHSAEKNPAQAYRRKLIFEALDLEGSQRPVRLLDVGSGQGDFCLEAVLRVPHAELVGIELSRTGVTMAQTKVPRARFIQQDLTQYHTPPVELKGWATHAVCSEVLEHLDQPERLLQNLKPYLAPHCRLVITVPGGPRSAFDRHIGHHTHFTRFSLEQLLKQSGFEPQLSHAAGFPFLNLYRLTVIVRGKRLIQDVSKSENGGLPFVANAAMRAFGLLFKFNLTRMPLGWQIIGLASYKPGK